MGRRRFVVNGESMVLVRFGHHVTADAAFMSGQSGSGTLFELGLATDKVRILPRFWHRDLPADDFGPDVPADVLSQMADCLVRMTLVHYNPDILESCMAESIGIDGTLQSGGLVTAGTPLGAFRAPPLSGSASSGCHYMTLYVLSEVEDLPWRFPTAYLTARPLEIPLSTEKSLVQCEWRAVPYRPPAAAWSGEVRSSGIFVWDHYDTGGD